MLEYILGDCCRVDAVLLVLDWLFGHLVGLSMAQYMLRRFIGPWFGEVANHVDPLLVPAEYAGADFVLCKRSNRLFEHAGGGPQIEHLGLQGGFTALLGFHDVLEKGQHEFSAVVVEIVEEGTVRFVHIVVDIQDRGIRRGNDWSKESLAAMLGTLYS